MNASESIADVLEALAERSVFWKGEVRRLEQDIQKGAADFLVSEHFREQAVAEAQALKRKLVQAKHQRDMARLALTDIHSQADLFRDDAENGRVEGGEAWLAVLGHTTRGLALSAQDDQPKEGA